MNFLKFYILHSDYHSVRVISMQKDQKNLPQTSHKIFSQCVIVNSSFLCAFMVQNFCRNSFSGGKSSKNNIPVIKITFSLQTPLELNRFPCVNTKTIKYTCRLLLHSCGVYSEIFHFIISYITLN